MAASKAWVAVVRDVVLGDAEDLTDLHPRLYLSASLIVGFLENSEEPVGGWFRFAVDISAAAVAPVTADGGAAIELDEVALLQAHVALRVHPDPHPGTDGGQ